MNTKVRVDAWDNWEDREVVRIVTEHIKAGKSQLNAFEVASRELSRTKEAIGFRFNKHLRSRYSLSIEEAKREAMQKKKTKLKQTLQYNKVYDKIILPYKVAREMDELKKLGTNQLYNIALIIQGGQFKAIAEYIKLPHNAANYFKAIEKGYTYQLTAEDEIRLKYEEMKSKPDFQSGMYFTLKKLGKLGLIQDEK